MPARPDRAAEVATAWEERALKSEALLGQAVALVLEMHKALRTGVAPPGIVMRASEFLGRAR